MRRGGGRKQEEVEVCETSWGRLYVQPSLFLLPQTSEAAHTDCRGKSLCFALYMLLATKGSYNFLSVNKNNQVGILESIESGFSDKKKQQQLLDTSVTSSPSLE